MEKTPLARRSACSAASGWLARSLHTTMTRTWNDLEGVSLGRYWLKACLASPADAASYLIRYDTTRDAAVRVRSAETPGADLQLDFWRKAMALEHSQIV